MPPRSPFLGCGHGASVLCAPDLISVAHLNRILHLFNLHLHIYVILRGLSIQDYSASTQQVQPQAEPA